MSSRLVSQYYICGAGIRDQEGEQQVSDSFLFVFRGHTEREATMWVYKKGTGGMRVLGNAARYGMHETGGNGAQNKRTNRRAVK